MNTQRTRQEILNQFNSEFSSGNPKATQHCEIRSVLEVLLDIRDLLSNPPIINDGKMMTDEEIKAFIENGKVH